MERNGRRKSLKAENVSSNGIKECNRMLKDSWNCFGEDYISGYSWPPRSYSCSFCKREFRSAQALGGHMNVHRRDRARLRQSPPSPSSKDAQYPSSNPNPNPNPNPNSNPNPNFSTMLPSFNCTLPSLVSSPSSTSHGTLPDPPSPRGSDLTKILSTKSYIGVGKCHRCMDGDGSRIFKKAEIVSLDLEIGLLSHSKEDLDLELRLGYA